MYKVVYKESVENDFKGIDRQYHRKILDAIEEDLAENPRGKGKPLKGEWKGLWKYYIWPYRVIYEIFDSEGVIRIDRIGHRKDVYR